MTQDNNSQLSVRALQGAAATVMTIVAKTATNVNELSGQLNRFMVASLKGSLRHALLGGAINVVGEALYAGTQLQSGYYNFNKGSNSLSSSKETTDLKNSINKDIEPEQARQSQAFKNLQEQNGMNLMEGESPEQNIVRGNGEVADENTQSNTRADMDYHKSKIDTLNQEKSIGADEIKSKYEGLNSYRDGSLSVSMGFGMLFKAIGSATQGVHSSISQTLNQLAQSEQGAIKNANDVLGQLFSTASQLYAGNSMVRG